MIPIIIMAQLPPLFLLGLFDNRTSASIFMEEPMANRRFEIFQYQHVLPLIRSGESDRDLARTGAVGRRKAGKICK